MKVLTALEKLKKPKAFVVAICYVFTILLAGLSIYMLLIDFTLFPINILAYSTFIFSAVFLAYSVYLTIIYRKKYKNWVKSFIKRFPALEMMLENFGFRTLVLAIVSLVINLLFVVFNGVIAIINRSIWYGSLATYYLLLVLLRSVVVLHHKKTLSALQGEYNVRENQIKKYKFCAILLIILPICLLGAIFEMVVNDVSFVRIGYTVYLAAFVTFYSVAVAIVNVVKAKKVDDLTIKALSNISLAVSFVSILALQTSLFYAFGNGQNYALFNLITGAVVSALTITVGVIMLKKIKKYKLKKD